VFHFWKANRGLKLSCNSQTLENEHLITCIVDGSGAAAGMQYMLCMYVHVVPVNIRAYLYIVQHLGCFVREDQKFEEEEKKMKIA
jgi:hypothetical protein